MTKLAYFPENCLHYTTLGELTSNLSASSLEFNQINPNKENVLFYCYHQLTFLSKCKRVISEISQFLTTLYIIGYGLFKNIEEEKRSRRKYRINFSLEVKFIRFKIFKSVRFK